jgi:hypothetical protein
VGKTVSEATSRWSSEVKIYVFLEENCHLDSRQDEHNKSSYSKKMINQMVEEEGHYLRHKIINNNIPKQDKGERRQK